MKKEMSLDLYDFIHILRKRIKLILLITILSTTISGILSCYVIKPTYESKATIVIGKDDANLKDESKYNYNDIMMFQSLVKTYAAIGNSTTVVENASAKLRNISAKDLSENITVTPIANTQFIEFKAQNGNPQEAYLMLNAVCNSFMQEAKRIFPGQNIQIMDEAKVPEQPIKPKKLLNIVMAFFIGLIASVGLTSLLEHMDNTLKIEEDINKYLDIPVIGVIPKDTKRY